MDRADWRATIPRVGKSQTDLGAKQRSPIQDISITIRIPPGGLYKGL